MQVKKSLSLLICCIFCFTINGCKKGKSNVRTAKTTLKSDESFVLSEVVPNHAKGFHIAHFNSFTRVTIYNPWAEGEIYAIYNLYTNDTIALPQEGTSIKIPLTSLVVNTFAYFEFLDQLGELDKITGTSDGFRIYNPNIRAGIQEGRIADLGNPFNMNIEKTLALKPQAVLTSAYAQRDNYSDRISQAGIPVIYNLEWMENSPLARAEWIKMIAAFFDKEEMADSIFNNIACRYLSQKEKTKNIREKHTVMTGDNFQGTWYVPGGNSFNAALFRDAGLDYYYKNDERSGSIGLDIETILTQFGDAEYWFGCAAKSYKELAEKDPKYLLFKAVKEKQVFNNDNRTTSAGGNDYFESAIAYPDLLLCDLIKAVYPHLLPHYTFTYIKELE